MSKNSDDKFSNDEFGVEGPAWADGKIINEAIFCEEFLSKHKILFSGGSFFTAEGRVVDEIPLDYFCSFCINNPLLFVLRVFHIPVRWLR